MLITKRMHEMGARQHHANIEKRGREGESLGEGRKLQKQSRDDNDRSVRSTERTQVGVAWDGAEPSARAQIHDAGDGSSSQLSGFPSEAASIQASSPIVSPPVIVSKRDEAVEVVGGKNDIAAENILENLLTHDLSLPREILDADGCNDERERVKDREKARVREREREARGSRLLAQKMKDPLLPLSEEERVDVLLAGIKCGSETRDQVKGKELLMVVGNTGVGKSLIVNYIHGCEMERDKELKVVRVKEDSKLKAIMEIGHTNQSMTFLPQLEADDNVTYLDCPVPLCNLNTVLYAAVVDN